MCGRCQYCLCGEESLCDAPGFTGWTRDGGYAEAVIVRAEFCFAIPDSISDAKAAPPMCAGLFGYRAWRKTCEGRPLERLGLHGFGAAAHILAQLALWKGQAVYALTRSRINLPWPCRARSAVGGPAPPTKPSQKSRIPPGGAAFSGVAGLG
jgi:propanol-preferring alcohol dehydrogenase